MVQYRRNLVPGGTHFFTVTLADRRRALLTERIDALGAAFRQCRARHPFETIAIVVMPEHLHCVWALPAGDADYAARWSLIKRAFTRKQYREGPTTASGNDAVWQPRFWEHAIRDDADLQRHVDYTHHNPVKHGCANRAADWPHSSFHRYVKLGWLAEDWAAGGDDVVAASFGEP
jgi:putative transposase